MTTEQYSSPTEILQDDDEFFSFIQQCKSLELEFLEKNPLGAPADHLRIHALIRLAEAWKAAQ